MRVLLVWPNYGESKVEYLPLALSYLKANTDSDRHRVYILDTLLENLAPNSSEFIDRVRAYKPDLIGFSATSDKFANSVYFAQQIKKELPNLPIVMGGIHTSSYPDETMSYTCFDYGFSGEAEFAFPKFLDALESGRSFVDIPGVMYRQVDGQLIRNAPEKPAPLDRIKQPDYNDIDLKRYYERGYSLAHGKYDHAPIWVSRGCPYTCKFCAAPDLNGRKMRYHSTAYVETWIRDLYTRLGVRHFNIVDDNFTYEMDLAKEILAKLISLRDELGISYAFPNGIRMQKIDEEMLVMIRKAGFTHVVYAPESGSPTMLKLMRKGLKADIIEPSIRLAHMAGLKVKTFWIVGYPGETEQTMEETRKVIMSCGTDMISLHVFQPLPGTPIFDTLVKENKISRNYLPMTYHQISNTSYVIEGLTKNDIVHYRWKIYIQHYLLKPWNIMTHMKILGMKILLFRILQLFRPSPPLKPLVNRIQPQ